MQSKFYSIVLFLSIFSTTFSQKKIKNSAVKYEKLQIDMFPKAEKGMKQYYIQVPISDDDNGLKVEVLVGKNLMVDCNVHVLPGEVKEVNLDGWGYNYYNVTSNGQPASTKMGCLDQKESMQFIVMNSSLYRYNSKLPLVFYIPEDMEIKYRIWKPESKFQSAKKN